MFKVISWMGALAAIVLVVGCASAPAAPAAPAAQTEQPRVQGNQLPSFVLNPPQAGDALYGVGVGQSARVDVARNQALARARQDLAAQIEVSIQAAVTDYFQEAGEGENTQLISFYESISRQVTDTTLEGVTPEEFAQDGDGNLWALVVMNKQNVLDAAGHAFARNEDAAFAQFQAQQALQALENQLQNAPPQAGASFQD